MNLCDTIIVETRQNLLFNVQDYMFHKLILTGEFLLQSCVPLSLVACALFISMCEQLITTGISPIHLIDFI